MSRLIEKLVVYVDGSEESVAAVQYGIMLAKDSGAEVHAVYVVNTRAISELVKSRIFLDIEQTEYTQDMEQDADRYLNMARRMGDLKEVSVHTQKLTGSVYSELRSYIKEHDIDLLLVGGISTIRSRRDEMYSESERAVRSAPCSVLIVKDEDRCDDLFEEM